jgi:hypothetical protein
MTNITFRQNSENFFFKHLLYVLQNTNSLLNSNSVTKCSCRDIKVDKNSTHNVTLSRIVQPLF